MMDNFEEVLKIVFEKLKMIGGIGALVGFVLRQAAYPKEDGRTRNGYKNNEKPNETLITIGSAIILLGLASVGIGFLGDWNHIIGAIMTGVVAIFGLLVVIGMFVPDSPKDANGEEENVDEDDEEISDTSKNTPDQFFELILPTHEADIVWEAARFSKTKKSLMRQPVNKDDKEVRLTARCEWDYMVLKNLHKIYFKAAKKDAA